MALIVQKFGGTTVRDAAHVRQVAARIADAVRRGDQIVVTVSAMGDETDDLLALPGSVSTAPNERELDVLVTSGERKASAMLCLALGEAGVRCESFAGHQAGILTDCRHTQAEILDVDTSRLRTALARGCVPIVGGAQGVSLDGHDTFLGRGGSDTTAVALAAALAADAVEMYTDVPGVFSADPRIVPSARLLERVGFPQMLEMCAAGCPKPATGAVRYASNAGVALHVRSASSSLPGTWISADPVPVQPAVIGTHLTGASAVSVIASRQEISATAIARQALAAAGIDVELAPVSPTRLSGTVEPADLDRAVTALHSAFALPRDAPPLTPMT